MSPAAARPALRLQLLGPVNVFVPDRLEPAPIPKGRASTLLALLAAKRNELISLDAISVALWPPSPPPNAGQLVACLVSRLRRVVGPAIEHIDGAFRLNTRGWAVDVDDAAQTSSASSARSLSPGARLAPGRSPRGS